MAKIWVLGINGMLGHEFLNVSQTGFHEVVGISRSGSYRDNKKYAGLSLDNPLKSLGSLLRIHGKPDYVLNGIGVVKPRITEKASAIANAYKVNSLFPFILDRFANENDSKILQIGTDCVFSGNSGNYSENEPHDAFDHYGLSKSFGEIQTENTKIIRCSIIGIERENNYSLVSWVQKQEKNAELSGFLNHNWNGVTTKAFAKIIIGIIDNKIDLNNKQHLVPENQISKFKLVSAIAKVLGRDDLKINEVNAAESINRTLSTDFPEINSKLWRAAGFKKIPSVEFLVEKYLI
jgi:dTDP-4-dehydrorhamnose reductase